MYIERSILAAMSSLLILSGCAASSQNLAHNQVAGKRCEALTNLDERVEQLLTANNIDRVEPVYQELVHFGNATPNYLEGALIYLVADGQSSDAYLERTFSCYAGSVASQSLTQDPFHVEGVRSISARSAGQTIRISVLGADRKSGEEIWRRAQTLRKGSGKVEVRQLSSAPQTSPAL